MRTVWAIFIIVGIALAILGIAFWKIGVSANHAGVVGYLGLVSGLLGLYASGVGFTLAIHQLIKTRSASEEASRAIDEIKAKLSTLSASGELERARFSLEETERHIHDGKVKNVRFSISPARQSLVRIHELNLDIFLDLRTQLEAAIEEINGISDTPEPWDKDISRKNGGLVRSYIDLTNRMHVRMSRG